MQCCLFFTFLDKGNSILEFDHSSELFLRGSRNIASYARVPRVHCHACILRTKVNLSKLEVFYKCLQNLVVLYKVD